MKMVPEKSPVVKGITFSKPENQALSGAIKRLSKFLADLGSFKTILEVPYHERLGAFLTVFSRSKLGRTRL